MTITEKQIQELRKIKELRFTKVKSFSDYSLASGIEEIDLTNVKGKIKDLLIEFFVKQYKPKKGDRTKTIEIWQQKAKGYCIITYKALHGCGYAWAQDLENEFVKYLVNTYNINRKSKTYKVLNQCSLFSF